MTLAPQHLEIVAAIMAQTVPHARWSIIGSRAHGTARPYSDLDLLIDAGAPLSFAQSGDLREAFEKSTLPFLVDLVDARTATPEFLASLQSPLPTTP